MEENINKDEKEFIDLKEERAMIMLPEDVIEVEINATIYTNGELRHVSKHLSNKELREAFRDADKNYIGPDDVFELID